MINISTIRDFVGGNEDWAKYLEKLAIGFINSYLWYKIEDHENVYEADCLKTEEYLPQYPINSITSIKRNTGDHFAPEESDWETVDSTDYRLSGTAGKLISRNYIGDPVKITYRTGFMPYVDEDNTGNVPAEIELAINFLAKYYHQASKNADIPGNLKSETVDGDKVEFYELKDPATTEHLQTLLSNYVHYDLVA